MDATCKTCPSCRVLSGALYDGEPTGFCRLRPVEVRKSIEREWCSEHPLRQRDRLAAMAMNLAHPTWSPAEVAEHAYRVADAMLAARGEEPTP